MFKKNISDGVGSPNGSNGTPLDPPHFWLDNIFKFIFVVKKTNRPMAVSDSSKKDAKINSMTNDHVCDQPIEVRRARELEW